MRKSGLLSKLVIAFFAAASSATANDVIFRGNLHTSVNNASLSINALDQLVVDILGPGGNNGVSIAVGQAESVDLSILPQSPTVPVGANERFTARGTVAGTPNIMFADFGFLRGTGNMTFDATFPAFISSPRAIQVFAGGTLINTTTNTTTLPQIATIPSTAWPRQVGVRRNLVPQNRPAIVCKWAAPIPISIIGGPTLTGDEVRVAALTPSNTLDLVAQVGGTGSDVPEMFIDDEDTVPTCPGDLDGDGDVDIVDLSILLAHFGAVGNVLATEGDLDSDGDVDIGDLSTMLANFGNTC